jgi:hypothetical protein
MIVALLQSANFCSTSPEVTLRFTTCYFLETALPLKDNKTSNFNHLLQRFLNNLVFANRSESRLQAENPPAKRGGNTLKRGLHTF